MWQPAARSRFAATSIRSGGGTAWISQEAGDFPAAGEADKGQMGVGRIGGSSAVPCPVLGMVVPGPRDDGFLRNPAEEVSQRLAIAVPQFLPGHGPAHGPPGDLPHHGPLRQVKPDDRVRPGPDDRPYRAVVAVDNPPTLVRPPRDEPLEFVLGKRFPAWLVKDAVEFNMRHAKAGGQFPCER